MWTRGRAQAVWIALWLAVNPVVFGEPAQHRAWSTWAMLGEELWISRRPRDGAMLVSAMTSAAAVGAVYAARRHRLRQALIAVAVQMALTLVYWQQMVRYLERHSG
ncbi:hypothetical protein MMAN_08830 [Mycobacterium mantenii]|uniref:Uncharacterized protein n=1 Tax=Mycobacterium mantenii TaxID=560555 RepID=A0ABM7JPA9_MYCNT|nr:hypothetical protein MMAN_08830 [Mycobacterium mantenii]